MTVVVEFDQPLAAGLSIVSGLTPLSFSFSDGINTITQANAIMSSSFLAFETDVSGNIVGWSMRITSAFSQDGAQRLQYIGTPTGFDRVEDVRCGPDTTNGCQYSGTGFYAVRANTNSTTGTWALQTAPQVPEPSSLLLVGAALAGLAARRRVR